MQKWSPFSQKHSQPDNEPNAVQEFIAPKQLNFTKPADAFMAQFESIADGPLDGFVHAAGFNVSFGKHNEQVTVEPSLMSDITNQGDLFVLQPSVGLSSSLFVMKPECSVLQSQLLHDVEILDHLQENK